MRKSIYKWQHQGNTGAIRRQRTDKEYKLRTSRRQRGYSNQAIWDIFLIINKIKLYRQSSQQSAQVHEIYSFSYTDKNILTIFTLSITQIQRWTKSRILKGSSNSIGWKQTQHQNSTKWLSYNHVLRRTSTQTIFITINNRGQVIIGPNKKTVATYMVGELEVLIWFMGTWMLKRGYYYNQYLMNVAWTRVKGNDDMIGYAEAVSVSTSCNRCSILAWSLLFYNLVNSCTMDDSLMDFTYI